ncbi:MAG: hypothetical protein NWE93_05105 [Candidatus Bathyarchaeota archaeon]|nr:hypothetical protein [Candidatus Bathyarchaeota archaeon]
MTRFELAKPKKLDKIELLKGHLSTVNCIALTPNGCCLVSGSQDKTARVWSMLDGECLRVLKGHQGPINSVVVSGDGKFAVTGSSDKKIIVWSLQDGEALATLEGHQSVLGVMSLALSADGRILVSSDKVKEMFVWSLPNRKRVCQVKPPRKRYLSGDIAMTVDGRYAVVGDFVWSLPTKAGLFASAKQLFSIGSLGAIITYDGVLINHVGGTRIMLRPLFTRSEVDGVIHYEVASRSDTSNGTYGYTAAYGGACNLYSGTPSPDSNAYDGNITALGVSPDGGKLASITDHHIVIRRLDNGWPETFLSYPDEKYFNLHSVKKQGPGYTYKSKEPTCELNEIVLDSDVNTVAASGDSKYIFLWRGNSETAQKGKKV